MDINTKKLKEKNAFHVYQGSWAYGFRVRVQEGWL